MTGDAVNVDRLCRDGHTYTTAGDGPGVCWCGARAALAEVKPSLSEALESDGPVLGPGAAALFARELPNVSYVSKPKDGDDD